MDSQLKTYVETQKKAGTPDDQIRSTLLETGWDEASINEAMSNTSQETSEPTSKIPVEAAKASSPGLTPKIKSSTKLLPVLIVIIIGAIIGGGVWAYFKYFPKVTPEEVLVQALEKTNSATSYEFNSKITADLTLPKEELAMAKAALPITSSKFDIIMSGSAHKTDKQIDADISLSLQNEDTKIFEVQERIKDYKVYYKLNNLNIPLAALFVDLDLLKENWINISSNDLLSEDEVSSLSDEELLQAYMETIEDIENEIDFNKLYTLKNVYDMEMVDNIKSYHYQVEINKNELVSIIDKVAKELAKTVDETITNQDIDELMNEFKNVFSKVTLPPIDIWIGKKDMYIHQIHTRMKLHDINVPEVKEMFSDSDTLSLRMNMKNFNTAAAITTPENIISIDDLMKKMQENSLGDLDGFFGDDSDSSPVIESELDLLSPEDAILLDELDPFAGDRQPVSALDTVTDTDGDGLMDADEDKYGTDRNNPDTDGDGFSDGKEVSGGYNPNGPGKLPQ